MGWPLEARRSLFPDWPWLCDESSPHRRALHIPVQILAGKFKMEFLPTISLTKAFPVAQIRPNLHKNRSQQHNPFLIIGSHLLVLGTEPLRSGQKGGIDRLGS